MCRQATHLKVIFGFAKTRRRRRQSEDIQKMFRRRSENVQNTFRRRSAKHRKTFSKGAAKVQKRFKYSTDKMKRGRRVKQFPLPDSFRASPYKEDSDSFNPIDAQISRIRGT